MRQSFLEEKKKIFVQLSHNKKLFVSFLIEMNIRGMRDSIINNKIVIAELMNTFCKTTIPNKVKIWFEKYFGKKIILHDMKNIFLPASR